MSSETLKLEWQCGQFLELNPTCAFVDLTNRDLT